MPSGILTVQNGAYTYFLFGFLWTNAWINAIAWTSLSGSYAHWYFFRRDDKYSSRFPLTASVYRTLRYHLGSLAFGAFLIAVIQLLRIFAEILDRQTKRLQVGRMPPGDVALTPLLRGARRCRPHGDPP